MSSVLWESAKWLLTPSDLVASLDCAHRIHLEARVARNVLERPQVVDRQAEMLQGRGMALERAYLERLRTTRDVVTFDRPSYTERGLGIAHEATAEAMRRGVDALYQPTLFDGTWFGHPDFLVRVPGVSDLGDWHYEIVESKLARHAKPEAVVQATAYAELASGIQGPDTEIRLVLGNQDEVTYRAEAFEGYVQLAQRRLEAELARSSETYPEPVAACETCVWLKRCDSQRRSDDHLGFVAGIGRDQVKKLRDQGVSTLEKLAVLPVPTKVKGIGAATVDRLRTQAELQLHERQTGEQRHKLLAPTEGKGLDLLPVPSPGDVFFDLEGDPLSDFGSLEYLWGWVEMTNTH